MGDISPMMPINGDVMPASATKDGDAALFDMYLDNSRHRVVTGCKRREALGVFATFKSLVDGKLLKDCDRSDGRKLAAHYTAQGLKPNSVRKLVMWLPAACNFLMDEGDYGLKRNPFKGVAKAGKAKDGTALTKLRFSDSDMATIKASMGRLSDSDQPLIRVLASTGMRLGEPFQIEREQVCEDTGLRYVVMGSKTDASYRRVPLPEGFPAFTGRLFPLADTSDAGIESAVDAAGHRLNDFLRDIGISFVAEGETQSQKSVHSFRHRAKWRLSNAGCPKDTIIANGGWTNGKRGAVDTAS
jgi:integrase